MTNDRELLEHAAKAAGMEGMRYASPYMGMVKMIDPTCPETTGSIGLDWNPLTDDGDALRLAVKLNLGISIPVHKTIRADVVCFRDSSVSVREEGSDPHAATRRAIVCAAAEIGRSME